MTANDFLSYCLNVMGDTAATSGGTEDYFINVLNSILSECLPYENSRRLALNEEELESAQSVSAISDTLTYGDEVLKNIVLWGVCALLALSDDNTNMAGYYNQKYEQNKAALSRARYVAIESWW